MDIYRVWTVSYFGLQGEREDIDYVTECLESNVVDVMNSALANNPFIAIIFAVEIPPRPRIRQLRLL